jgi:hypothetical protein
VAIDELPPDSVKFSDDDVRARLAFYLAYIFAGTIVISFLLLAYQLMNSTVILDGAGKPTGQTAPVWEPAKELVANLLSAEIGLFGTVLGFYFGGKGR